jgi:hypothetical protein
MLHSQSNPAPLLPEAAGRIPSSHGAAPLPSGGSPTDAAIDAALCGVALPVGLLTRLNAMLADLNDDAAQRGD